MPSAYLTSGDYATYGVAAGTDAGQVTQASTLVDMFLKRREGLVWTPDASGQPCYMTAANPTLILTAPGQIAPGLNVTVPVTGPAAMLQPGDVLILDRANPTLVEAVIVNTTAPGQIGLTAVTNAHSAGALLEAGLVILEQKFMPKDRPICSLGRTPVSRIVSGSGRYGYGRRGDSGASSINDFNLLAVFSQFGGPPVWELFNPTTSDFDANTGQLWVPAGVFLAYYTETKIRYLAGFSAASLPSEIKLATAFAINALANAPNLGNVKSYKAGDTAIENFSSTIFSQDMRDMLQPFAVRAFA